MLLAISSILPKDLSLPALVFAAETCVLTLATLRTIFIARGKKIPAAMLGFFEVSIWLFAIGQVMQNLGDWGNAVAFAAGFALGNYLGVLIEQKLALGNLTVSITTKDADELATQLRSAGFGATTMNGQGTHGPVEMVISVIERKHLSQVTTIIETVSPRAFYAVNHLQATADGIFPKNPTNGIVPAPFRKMIRSFIERLPQGSKTHLGA